MFKKLTTIAFLIFVCSVSAFLSPFLQAAAGTDSQEKVEIFYKKKSQLCLTMIVKNESRIIERCLNSVKGVVDCISICDTGSTDNTIAIIETFMKKNNVPGKVHRHEWQNFGYNRTLSIQAAQKTLEELEFPLSQTYLLLLDADMILEIDRAFDQNELRLDSYLLLQKSADLSYYNTRLVRASLPWRSIGVTHEYWGCEKTNESGKLHTLWIDDQEDGGCKADKFERDVKLLTQGLKDEPNNVRYMFYLAQSYKCLNQYADAIHWYKSRIERGGWKEEIWFSKVMIGECYQDMGNWDHALHWYLDAYQFNSERAEPLQKIANYYRLNGQNDLAYLFAKQGACIPYPKDQILFISHPVYDYQFEEEISIAAYYTPFKEEGFAAANRLVLRKNIPQNVRDQTYRNLIFYTPQLKCTQILPISIDLPLLREGLKERYYPMNPSIQKTAEGYDLICRTVNYTHDHATNFKSRDPLDESLRTKNFLVRYDPHFKLLSQNEIIDDIPQTYWQSLVKGLEDCRLFSINDKFWFICTTFGTHPHNIGQTLCRLASKPSNLGINIEKYIPLIGPIANRCEKNWLPFIKDHELYAFYSYDPVTIYKIDKETGHCETAVQYETEHDFSEFRGSAAPIEFDDGYLMLVHEVAFSDHRYYFHRFIYLDKDFIIKKVSKPFVFLHRGIEFCCSMAIDRDGKNCIMPIGIEDQQAYLFFVDLDHIRSILEPLP